MLAEDLGSHPNIEKILSRARSLGDVLSGKKVSDLDGAGYAKLAEMVCSKIGEIVDVVLPSDAHSYLALAGWVGGANRANAVEIFTTNYDLLIEEAFERHRKPFFDGFSGGHRPFFDSASVLADDLPPRWTRIWKLHGSLGWDLEEGRGDDVVVVKTFNRATSRLIYPTHLKYDQVQRQPYASLFERLRRFLLCPDSLLICSGFSFSDRHITAVIDESLSANPSAAVFAFQFGDLLRESGALELARRRSNMSVYSPTSAVVNCIEAEWRVGEPPHKDWEPTRRLYWDASGAGSPGRFLLGDFSALARFIATIGSRQVVSDAPASSSSACTVSP
jgi:hypothetical protein